MFTGAYTAIVTPFRDGKVDEEALRRLIDRQIEGGIAGIVPAGSTGEAATLDREEHLRVIAVTVEQVNGRVKVIAGTGSNSTAEAIDLSCAAAELGVDGVLLASPYYNKPTQEGIYRHFSKISASVQTQIMLYNVPGRTASEISVETCVRLAKNCPNITSIKEAGGSCDRVSWMKNLVPDHFSILSGDDSLLLPFLAVGAVGVVSVASNVIPREIADLVQAFLAGRVQEAQELHWRFFPLMRDLFIESNPIPVKTALAELKLIEPEFRLPLCEMQAATSGKLRSTLESIDIL